MPHKTKTGWKWANIKRKTKGELAKTVYGIWRKNGSKGSFSDFWHGKDNGENTNESEILTPGETASSVNGLKTINTSRTGSEHMNTETNNTTTLVESWGTPWQRITHDVIAEANSSLDDQVYYDDDPFEDSPDDEAADLEYAAKDTMRKMWRNKNQENVTSKEKLTPNDLFDMGGMDVTLYGAEALINEIMNKLAYLRDTKNPIRDMYYEDLIHVYYNWRDLNQMMHKTGVTVDSPNYNDIHGKFNIANDSLEDNLKAFELQLNMLAKEKPVYGIDVGAMSEFYHNEIKPTMDRIIRRLNYVPLGLHAKVLSSAHQV